MKAYQAMYFDSKCTWHIISTHFTKEGAENAMNKNKEQQHQGYLQAVENLKNTPYAVYSAFGYRQEWKVEEIEIFE